MKTIGKTNTKTEKTSLFVCLSVCLSSTLYILKESQSINRTGYGYSVAN